MKIFKNILVGMLAVAFIGTAISYKNEVVAASTDWEISDHNWDVNWEQSGYDVGVNVRNQYRSDYDHVELSVTRHIFTPLTIAVRIAEEDGAREYRPTLTQSVINWNVLKDAEGMKDRLVYHLDIESNTDTMRAVPRQVIGIQMV